MSSSLEEARTNLFFGIIKTKIQPFFSGVINKFEYKKYLSSNCRKMRGLLPGVTPTMHSVSFPWVTKPVAITSSPSYCTWYLYYPITLIATAFFFGSIFWFWKIPGKCLINENAMQTTETSFSVVRNFFKTDNQRD